MKKLKQAMFGLLLCAMVVAMTKSTKAYALSDGAYTVSVSYSYKNPETGKTADGSTNIALGESMIGSMLEDTALIEQVNGKTYVTIGLGLMSNVSNVKIATQTSSGSYKQTAITKTGSGTKAGDTVNHYRFQVSSTERYISPALFIDPMGREVQFFVKLKMGTKKSGSGIYNAKLASSAEEKKTEAPKATATPKVTEKPKATATAKPAKTPAATATATEKPEATSAPETEAPKTEEETKIEETVATKEPSATSEAISQLEVESVQQAEETETDEKQQTKTDHTTPICIAIIIGSIIGTAGLGYSNYRAGQRDRKKGKNDE